MSSKDFRFGISSNVQGVDLNQLLIEHPLNTYFMKVADDMPVHGLQTGDILLVDRSLKPRKTDLVIVGEPEEAELKIARFSEMKKEFQLWGVVGYIIRSTRP